MEIMEKLRIADAMTPELKQTLISLFDVDGAISEEEVPSRVPAKSSLQNAAHVGIHDSKDRSRHMFCPPSDAEIPEFTSVEDFVVSYDTDGDGLISQHEIPGWAVIINLEESLRTSLLESGILDISIDNLPAPRDEMLTKFDTDQDGKISCTEVAASGIVEGGRRNRLHFKGMGDRALSNFDCKESCSEIFAFYHDLFRRYTS